MKALRYNDEWKARVAQRFSDRSDLGPDFASNPVWGGLGLAAYEIRPALVILEEELGVAPGRFRPDDELEELFRPVTTAYNPVKWIIFRGNEQETSDYIVEELHRRTRRTSNPLRKRRMKTIADFVYAWCGKERSG